MCIRVPLPVFLTKYEGVNPPVRPAAPDFITTSLNVINALDSNPIVIFSILMFFQTEKVYLQVFEYVELEYRIFRTVKCTKIDKKPEDNLRQTDLSTRHKLCTFTLVIFRI